MSDQPDDRVLIYAGDKRWYWKQDRCGYTSWQYAGVFSRAEAMELTSHCGPEKKVEFHPVPEDHIPTLKAERNALARKVVELRMAIKEVHDTLTPLWRRIPSKTPDDPPIRSLEFTDDQVREVYDAIAVLRSAAKEGK